jgi:hypothetical protein
MRIFYALLVIVLFTLKGNAQCLTATNGQWPSSAFTPACTGGFQSITTCGYASEYSTVNVTSGVTYTFSSSIATDVITIGNSTGSTSYATGSGSVVWTATFTGVIRFYTHTSGCGAQSTCRTRSVACSSASSSGQCLTATNGQYPSTTYSPPCTGTSGTITTCGFASEYSMVNVTSGVTYTFSSSIATDIITISNSTGTTSYATGTGSVVWTATFTGTIRFYTHTSGCGASSTCRTRMVNCGTPPSGGGPCLTATNGQYPSTTYAPACAGIPENITTCGFASEYSMVSVTSGVTYTFSSSISTDIITISNSTGTTSYTSGTGSVVWTATFTGTIRFYTHTAGCGASSTCRNRTMNCLMVAPPSGNEDCINGTQVCNNSAFSGNNSGYDTQELSASNQGCLGLEHQSSWYFFQVATSGTIELTITTAIDYDFAIWGPNVSCGALGTPIRCSYSGNYGNTGLSSSANDNSENGLGDGWVAPLPVTAGQTFIMLIDNFTANSTSFTLNWNMTGGASLNCLPIVLPVEFLSFTGTFELNHNLLQWVTARESNNKYFILERSTDGSSWTTVAQVKGSGSSSSKQEYQYEDYSYEKNKINYYRLSQADNNEQVSAYRMLQVDNSKTPARLYKIYPNPTDNTVNVSLTEPMDVKVYDIMGRLVFEKQNVTQTAFDLIESGLYTIQISSGKESFTERVIRK